MCEKNLYLASAAFFFLKWMSFVSSSEMAPPPTGPGAPGCPHSSRSSQPILQMQGLGPAPPLLSPQPMIQVAPESLHHLAALLLGHEGCGAQGQGSGGSQFGWVR